jgi:nitrate reductase delta subunit
MDALWEEEAVSFMGTEEACNSQTVAISPLFIMPREQYLTAQNRSL